MALQRWIASHGINLRRMGEPRRTVRILNSTRASHLSTQALSLFETVGASFLA